MPLRRLFGEKVSPHDLALLAEDPVFASGPAGDAEAASAIRAAANGNHCLVRKALELYLEGADLEDFETLRAYVRLGLADDPNFTLEKRRADRYAWESLVASVSEVACRSAMDGTWKSGGTVAHLRAAAGDDLDIIRAARTRLGGGADPDEQVGRALLEVACGESQQNDVEAVAERSRLLDYVEFIHAYQTSQPEATRLLLLRAPWFPQWLQQASSDSPAPPLQERLGELWTRIGPDADTSDPVLRSPHARALAQYLLFEASQRG